MGPGWRAVTSVAWQCLRDGRLELLDGTKPPLLPRFMSRKSINPDDPAILRGNIPGGIFPGLFALRARGTSQAGEACQKLFEGSDGPHLQPFARIVHPQLADVTSSRVANRAEVPRPWAIQVPTENHRIAAKLG